MQDQEERNQLICHSCQREVPFGGDLITTEKGVSGPRGVVPLGDDRIFCSERCVSAYFRDEANGDLVEIQPRIP